VSYNRSIIKWVAVLFGLLALVGLMGVHSSEKTKVTIRESVDQGLAFKIAIFNTLGLMLVITSPMLIDPQIKTDYIFGDTRQYSPLLWLLLLLCLLVFFLTYQLFEKGRPCRRNLWLPLLPLGIMGALIGGFAFYPHRPHDGALFLTFGYGLVSFSTVALRQARDTGEYLDNSNLDFNLRVERLKATIATWQQLTVYGLAAYLTFVIAAIAMVWTVSQETVEARNEQILLGAFGVGEILILSVCVIVGPLNEALVMTLKSIEKLTEIRADNRA
jgi:hypothetical protein